MSRSSHQHARRDPGAIVGGRYEITRCLSEGQFSALYEARHRTTGHPAVIKLAVADGTDPTNAVARFRRQVRVLAHLSSAHTVRLLDAGQDIDGTLFMALEFLDGLTLATMLAHPPKQGPAISAAAALEVAVAALRSLAELHVSGLVHRNLRPSHVFLHWHGVDEFGIKLLDFGIVGSVTSVLTGAGSVVGTPTYMSPEQATGRDADGRSDLYALGVLLFECLEGKPPFEGEVVYNVIHQHVTAPLPPLTSAAAGGLSARMAGLVTRLMAKSPDDRPDGATDVLEEIASWPERQSSDSEVLKRAANGARARAVRALRMSAPPTKPTSRRASSPQRPGAAVAKTRRAGRPSVDDTKPGGRPGPLPGNIEEMLGAAGGSGSHPSIVGPGRPAEEGAPAPSVPDNKRQRLKGLKEAADWLAERDES